LHPKRDIESELKWQTCQILCIKVHQNATAQKRCSSGKGLTDEQLNLIDIVLKKFAIWLTFDVLHPRQNVEGQLKWQTCYFVHQNATALNAVGQVKG